MITHFTEVIESNNFLSKDTNTFISEDDIYCNFNQFTDKKMHICFVTGFSGSGKSTLARKLARKYNAEYIELDLITFAASKRSVTFDWLNSKGEYLLIDYIKQQKINPTDISDKYSYDQRLKFMDGFISWLVNSNRKRCIVEGVNLIEIFPMHSEWKSLPFVFKGTSLLKSVIRRISRSGGIDINNIDDLLKTIKSWDNMYRGNQPGYDYIRNKVMRHKGVEIDEVDEDSLTAKKMGIIFSDDDVHYNVQRFLNMEVPVLWITGMSGGGKSTLAGEMADKAPGVISLLSIDNLDDFVGIYVIEHDMKTINKWRKDKVYDIIYKFIKDNEKLATDAFNDTHNKKWQDFVATVLKYVVKFYTPKKQIIIEGVQIPYVYYRAPELFRSDSAIIIKGTSVLTSVIRRYKRDQDRGWFINKFSDIKKYFDMYCMWYRTQNDFRFHVTPNMESWDEEKAIIKSMSPKDQEYAKGSRAHIRHHYIYKDGDKPVGFVDLMEDTNNNPYNVYMFIGIDPKYRGKGIFQKLVHHACEWLDANTKKYKAIMYYIDKDNVASINAISKVKCFKRQSDAYGKVVFKYTQFSRHGGKLESYTPPLIYKQTTDYTCAPACALNMLSYYTGRTNDTEENIALIMGTNKEVGTTIHGVIKYFKQLGWCVNSSIQEGSPSEYEDFELFVEYNIDHNRIIMVENKYLDGHWRIITGYDRDNELLTFIDPYSNINNGITVMSAREFFTTWYDDNIDSAKTWVTAIPNKK